MKRAVGYLRVSGAGQVEGTGFDRQKAAIEKYADTNGITLTSFYQEKGISGTKEEIERLALMNIINENESDGVQYVIVENLDRLARELKIQEQLVMFLCKEGFEVISANTGENVTRALQDDPMRRAMVQVQGVFAELDKNLIVAKLRKGREATRKINGGQGILTRNGIGKCEGRKRLDETNPDLVIAVKKAARKPRGGKRPSLRKVADMIADEGYLNAKGKAYGAMQIKRLLEARG